MTPLVMLTAIAEELPLVKAQLRKTSVMPVKLEMLMGALVHTAVAVAASCWS